MSAFILDTATIDQIISTLAYGTASHGQSIACLVGKSGEDVFESYWIPSRPVAMADHEELARLAFDLHAMNTAAFNVRYRENIAPSYSPAITPAKVRPLLETFKATNCLIYNSAEGEIPQTPLFKCLRSFEGFLGRQIAQTLPAYDSAPWG